MSSNGQGMKGSSSETMRTYINRLTNIFKSMFVCVELYIISIGNYTQFQLLKIIDITLAQTIFYAL